MRYKTTTTKCNSFFFKMQLKSGRGRASLAWRLENAHITLNIFQNRRHFLYISAFLLSFLSIVWILFYPGTSFLEPFSLCYDLIASYYTKGKRQCRQGYLFCFESCHFDKKMFLYICLFFSFWYEELIRSCLVWKQKFVFVIEKLMLQFFQKLLDCNLPRIGKECSKYMNGGQG